jgi:hypothetical protein
MPNKITIQIDGEEVASATVSSLDNLEALLMGDPRYGTTVEQIPGQEIMMGPGSTPIMGLPTSKSRPVDSPIDAMKAWFKEVFASKITEADTAAYMRARAEAAKHVEAPKTEIS